MEKAIENQSLVIVIGHPGLGKTAIIKNIALKYRADGWAVKSVKRIAEILSVICTIENKTLYVFDDPIGRQNIDDSLYESWIINVEKLMCSLRAAKKVKILLSCRKYMFSNDVKKYFGNESSIVDISNEQLKLNEEEKRQILNRYLSSTNISEDVLVEVENINLYFPLLCYLYSTNKQCQEKGLHFFTEYKAYFQKDIENFKINDNLKYCALVLLVLFNNEICVDDLLANEKSEAKFKRTSKVCTMDTSITPSKIGSILDSLVGFFVMKEDNTYQFSHDIVMQITAEEYLNNHPSEFIQFVDAAYLRKMVKLDNFDNDSNQFAVCLSNKYIDKLAERLFSDLSGNSFLDTVQNPCLKNQKVIEIIKKKIKENQETLKMLSDKRFLKIDNQTINEPTKKMFFSRLSFVKSEIEVTPLFALIAFGHTDLSQYCLKHLQEMQTNIEGYSLFTAVCCNGSIDLFNFIYKGETEKLKTEEYVHLSPIHIVSVFHNFTMLEELIKLGFNVNLKSDIKGKWTPLVLAAGNDTVENQYYNDDMSSDIRRDKTVTLLLKEGADINLRTEYGFSPLSLACMHGCYSTVKLLHGYGPDVNLGDEEGCSPLYLACSSGHNSIVKFLLDLHNVDINLCSRIGHSPLCAACFDGHESIVTLLLSKGAEVDLSMKTGLTPLYVACSFGHLGTVTTLLSYNADLNLPDSEGKTPLCAACFNGRNSIVQLLCEKGATLDLVEKDGFSPLLIACQNGHYETVKLLLDYRAEINLCTNEGISPLFIACHKEHEDIVNLLLRTGANFDLCNQDGVSPLMKACENNNDRIVQLLLTFGADINLGDQTGASPLCLACLCGHYSIVKLLINNKADVNLQTKDGASPLFAACQNGYDTIIDLLLNNKADINLCVKDGTSPLFTACLHGHDEVVQQLLEFEADPNLCTQSGDSPLFISCLKGYAIIVQHLLRVGAEVNSCTRSEASPLYIACQNGYYSIVELLIKMGENIHVNACLKNGISPLYIACQNGHDKIVQILINNGAIINLCKNNNASPLFIACQSGREEIVKSLLLKEADINICMEDGDSPLHAACYDGHDSIVQLLLNKGADTCINANNKRGLSPLYIAFYERHIKTVQLLLKKGADARLVNGCGIKTASIDWFDENDSIMQFLRSEDNINKNIHDLDSFFSLFVFCQVEIAERIMFELLHL